MAEQLTLTTPEVVPSKTTTYYRVVRVLFDWREARIAVVVEGERGELKTFDYEAAEALTLMRALNTANLSTLSLQKRILNRLVADGKMSGTVTGTPD